MQPLTISAGSARSPCSTTSWYQAAKSLPRAVIGDSAIAGKLCCLAYDRAAAPGNEPFLTVAACGRLKQDEAVNRRPGSDVILDRSNDYENKVAGSDASGRKLHVRRDT